MPKDEFFLSSPVDGLNLSVLMITPEGQRCRGVVQLVHGMCENKERYLPFMQYMASEGYVCVIHDHRGHGKSVRAKADLGYMYGVGAEGLLSDLHCINQHIHSRYPGKPVILFGHSMGSLAVRAYAAEHDDCINMLLVSGSPSKNPALPLAKFLAGAEGKLRGGRHKSSLLDALSTGNYAKKFSGEMYSCAWICSDPEIQRAYEESEYCGFSFTDDAYQTLFGLMEKAYAVKDFKCTNPDMPTLFLSGRDDPCMESMRRFALAVQDMRKAGYRDVRGRVYENMRHEILNEQEHEKVYHDIRNYIRNKGF